MQISQPFKELEQHHRYWSISSAQIFVVFLAVEKYL